MKTYLKVFDIKRGDVKNAVDAWHKNESGRKNYERIIEEYGSEDALIDEILLEITERRLSFRPISRSERRDRSNGKVRVIGVASVKQQVCDYVVVNALEGFLKAKVGFYQTANEKGKGLMMCSRALRRWSRTARYHIKADVRKCYPSIKTDLVMRILRKYVRSEDVLYVCEAIFATYDGCLEIGSYLSLKMSQLVLSFAYHHVESLHKVRRDKSIKMVEHQIWHLDDMILIGNDKRSLKQAMRSLVRFMRDELGLEVKPWKLCVTSRLEKLDLGGWAAYDGTVILRGSLFLRACRAFRQLLFQGRVSRSLNMFSMPMPGSRIKSST